jgi:hypothetical protein
VSTGVIILLVFAAVILLALIRLAYQKAGERLLARRISRTISNAAVEVSVPEDKIQAAPSFYDKARQEAEDVLRGTHSLR